MPEMRVGSSSSLVSCLGAIAAACGSVAGDGTGGSDETNADPSGAPTDPTTDPDALPSCAPAGEPACADCFLMLAALDRPTADIDIWLAHDGTNTVEFLPPSGDASAVAVTADGVGVAVHLPFFASELQAFVFADGAWSGPQPLGLAGGSSVLAAEGRCVHLLYRGADEALGHAVFDGTSWHVLGDAPWGAPEAGLGNLAARDGELVRVFHDGADVIHSVSRTTTWQAPQVLGDGDPDAQAAADIAALRVGGEFIVVHGGRYTTRVDGVWAPFATIPGTERTRHTSVAALRDGRALVVWHQIDGLETQHITHSLYDPVAATWTPPTELLGGRFDRYHTVAAGAAGDAFFLGYTHDGTGDSSYVLRFSGGASETLAYTIFGHDVTLASTP